MNKKNRKTKGFSHRLVALLLCCACLFSVTPISAIALGEEAAPAASVAEAQPEEAAELQVAEPEAEAEPEEPAQQEESAEPEAAEAAETEEAEAAPAAETAESTPAESETAEAEQQPAAAGEAAESEAAAEADAESQPADAEVAESEAASQPAESEAVESEPETEATEADKLYERLMACTTYEEMQEILNGLTEEEQALLDNFTEEQNAALEAKTEKLGGYEISTLESTYDIKQGSSQTVSINQNYIIESSLSFSCNQDGIRVEWVKDNRSNITGYKISVASTVPVKDGYELTVSYQYRRWKSNGFFGGTWETVDVTDTVTINVIDTELAKIYYLKTPTSDPDSNDTGEWCDNSIGNGTVRIGDDVTWTNNKNIFSPGTYVVSMADGMIKQEDGSWLLPKDKYSSDYTAVFNAYKTKLQNDLGVTLDSENDIEAIYLTPYKISKDNGTTPDKHIDCTISVKVKNVFAVRFWVDMPDGSELLAEGRNYKNGSLIEKTTKAPTGTDGNFPNTKVVGGITYKFVGWYNEANKLIPENKWNYAPNEAELADGTVNFYARYVKAENELTIQKTVSGNMYDPEKEFTFTVISSENMTDADGHTDKQFTFSLAKNDQKTITVPAGATVTVTEDPDGYKHTVAEGTTITDRTSIGNDGDTAQGIRFTMPDEEATVVFNNEKSVTIDTGVVLDTLPYVLILAVVAGGAVLMVKKRGKRDSD